MSTHRKKLIEMALPLREINAASKWKMEPDTARVFDRKAVFMAVWGVISTIAVRQRDKTRE